VGERRESTNVSINGCGPWFKAPSKDEREGDDMDFLRASQPGNRGGREGQGVRGTYPLVAEASSPGQEWPTSGDRLFLLNAPNMFFIVAPMEFLEFGTSWSLPAEGLASRHFWYLSLQAASMVLQRGPAVGSQWNTWQMNVSCAVCIMKAACWTLAPIPRTERNRTRHSSGACPSMKLIETVLGATATATVCQSSRLTFISILRKGVLSS